VDQIVTFWEIDRAIHPDGAKVTVLEPVPPTAIHDARCGI
jgi:hypothetical protein